MAVDKFPFEIFHPDIEASFRDLAQEYSLPLDYLGTSALFTIAALSGNMYRTELNGEIKNIMFCMLVGPSGTGKSPAYDLLCGNIVEPLNAELWQQYDNAHKEWREKKEAARLAKTLFTEPEPIRRIRMATGGTMEGIMKHAMTSPAGFGLYYDEGGTMLGSPNQYKKDTSSTDFWNKMWNGQPFDEMRADSSRERYIDKTSISVMVGMQGERLARYFNSDTVESGLPFRFLFTMAEDILLKEDVNRFDKTRRGVCWPWRNIVSELFRKGAYNYFRDDTPTQIPFQEPARMLFNQMSTKYLRASNALKLARKTGDTSSLLLNYESKLYAYFGRFLIILALLDNREQPMITEQHVYNASLLYDFYRNQARMILSGLQDDDLNDNERLLLDALPDEEFGREEILLACVGLKLAPRYFETAFRRKFRMGWIKKVSRGRFIKDI